MEGHSPIWPVVLLLDLCTPVVTFIRTCHLFLSDIIDVRSIFKDRLGGENERTDKCGCTLTLSAQGPSLYVRILDLWNQILTYKDGPSTETNKTFILAVDP